MADSIENYLVLIEGRKTYVCSLCHFMTKRLSDMRSHILSKKHISNMANKPAVIPIEEASLPIAVPIRLAVGAAPLEGADLINTPPKGRVKGKTYLSQYCTEAVKIDTTDASWGRTFEITIDDIKRWIVMTPNQYIEYFFLKIIKKIGVDKFPFRCVDKSRLKFYYNDMQSGWIEDIGNNEIHKVMRGCLGKTNISTYEMRTKTDEIDDEIGLDALTDVMYLYNCWALPVSSVQDAAKNKTDGAAKKENIKALTYLADILDCE